MLDRIDAQAVEAAITPSDTRHHPELAGEPRPGASCRKKNWHAVIAIAAKHNLWIIFDQVYADLTHDKSDGLSAGQRAPGATRTLVVGQHCSKHLRNDRLAPRLSRGAVGRRQADRQVPAALDLLRAALHPGVRAWRR